MKWLSEMVSAFWKKVRGPKPKPEPEPEPVPPPPAARGGLGLRRRFWPVMVLSLASWNCVLALTDASRDEPPEGTVPLEPVPAEYRAWWDELSACTGRTGDFDRIRWYVREQPVPTRRPGWSVYGEHEDGRIWLARVALTIKWMVMHEMGHAQGYGSGSGPAHPRHPFVTCRLTSETHL